MMQSGKFELEDSKQRVLLVSSYPFSQTSRGMDVLTEAFEREGWNVDHLNFREHFIRLKYHLHKVSRLGVCNLRSHGFHISIGLCGGSPVAYSKSFVRSTSGHWTILSTSPHIALLCLRAVSPYCYCPRCAAKQLIELLEASP